MNRTFKTFLTLAAVVAVAGCAAEEPGRLPRPEAPADVSVSSVGRAPALESFAAAVTSDRTAEVATRMSGTVERVLVDVGDRVRRGQPLVALDGSDVEARVAAARAQEELAERTFRRIDNLAREGAASRQELDQAEAALAGARAARSEAEAQQGYAVVRAPFDGVVTRRSVDPGDLAAPGRPLVTIVSPGALKVVADVPAHRSGTFHAGMRVDVRPASGEAVTATVVRVVPALGEANRTFRVEARLDEELVGLVAGAYARLEVERPGDGARWLPVDAVVSRGQLTGVYAVESDTLRLRWVRLGRRRDDSVELLAGPAGEVVVVRRPAAELFDGLAVGSVEREEWEPELVAVAGGGEVEG